MGSTNDADDLDDGLPVMLTVTESARVLRIGRTLAYQLASSFLAGDARGLPVIRLGGCLRVPRWALIEFMHHGRVVSDLNARVVAAVDACCGEPDVARSIEHGRRSHRTSPSGAAQLALVLES